MSDWGSWEECECGRGSYDPEEYRTCFECYMERRDDFLECIWCGKWHSPRFDTCFECRRLGEGRDEAGRNLRMDILIRDGFACRYCGSLDQPEVDHIKPCFEGGTAALWNLQTLCRKHNQSKGRSWAPGCEWDQIRVHQMHLYFTYGWRLLDDEQRQALYIDAAIYDDEFTWHTNWRRLSVAGFDGSVPDWAVAMADLDGAEVEAA